MNRLITVIIIFFSINALAGELVEKNIIENIGNIHSIAFENSTSVTVYLPDRYKENVGKYPVMYVVDGERYFLNAIAYQKALVWQDKSPAFIVVGINIEAKNRRELLGNKSLEFIDTFQNQIVNYVENNYRTNNIRMYFGWEMAGGFALDLFSKRPKLIDAYFLASSTNFTQERLDSINTLFNNKTTSSEFIYYTLGDVESWALESHNELAKILTKHKKSGLNWEFYLSTNGDHYSTPLDTFNKGLTQYFKGYSPVRFYSIEEFENFGGMPALKEYYKKRGEHFQISGNIHDDTKHYLLNQSINENKFKHFRMLVKEFDGFIEGHNYSSGFLLKIGRFYENNGAVNEAIYLYKSELLKNPESKELLKELAGLTPKT